MRAVVPITLAGALIAIAVTGPGAARADDSEEAAEHFALAESAEKRQDWKSAIDEYGKAYAIRPHPSVLYNIARNYERLEDWANASEYFRRYLAGSPDASDKDKVEARIAELDAKAKAARPPPQVGSGWLVVTSDVDGTDVSVDGKSAGATPFEGEVPAGKHHVVLSKVGYRPAARDIDLSAGGTEQIRETLVATGEKPPEAVVPRKTAVGVFGAEYGYSFSSTTSYRLAGFAGVRLWEALELDAIALLSEERALGVQGRWYFGRGDKLPYLHVVGTVGKRQANPNDLDLPTKGAEAGVGLLWRTANGAVLHYGLFSEISARYVVYGGDGDATVMSEHENGSRFAVMWVFGFLID